MQDQFCVLNYEPSFDAGIGYFRFYYNDSISKDLPGIKMQSEIKSYAISILICIMFVWSVLYIYYKRTSKYSINESYDDNHTLSWPEID